MLICDWLFNGKQLNYHKAKKIKTFKGSKRRVLSEQNKTKKKAKEVNFVFIISLVVLFSKLKDTGTQATKPDHNVSP